MRRRAEEAMEAALAAADDGASALAACIETAIAAIRFVCEDAELDPRDRVTLIDDALLMLASLKDIVRTANGSPFELTTEVFRRTNGLLRRYSGLVRASPRRHGL